MKLISTLSLCVIILAGMTKAAVAELPQITDARVVQPPPGSDVAAAYFTISNTASEPLQITGASSDIAKTVEVHLSFVENDVAKMEKQDSVTVEAGDSLDFEHGSYHVMFMGMNEELTAGNSLDLTLDTSAGNIEFSVPIVSVDDAVTMQHNKNKIKNKKESATKETQ